MIDVSRPCQKRGFTLIEVTLAIVIGIIMIAGATLIYNQAKTSAGNSRAQAKVLALQQLVEEYAARAEGLYPNVLNDLNSLWARKRPDDWNKSPWGGVLGSKYRDQGGGVANWPPSVIEVNFNASTSAMTSSNHPTSGSGAQLGANGTQTGGLVYDLDPTNAIWQYGDAVQVGDIMTNRTVTVKGYAVYICDQQGRYPNFITGGKPNM